MLNGFAGNQVVADTLAEASEALKLDPQAMERTVAEYNAAVRPGEFRPHSSTAR